MKLKFRVLSVCLILSFLVMACGSAADDINTESVSVEKEDTNVVASPTESTEVADAEMVVSEPELSQEEKEKLEWTGCMMADVEESLNVRQEADAESELAGKLEKGDRATVLEIGPEWTKIESGKLVGYVKNEYCIYGMDALAYAKENCETIATTTTEGLRVRKEMNTDSKIMKRLEEGDSLVVDTSAEVEDGWVAVKYKDDICYVSAEFVTVSLNIGTGMTIEEIEEQRRAEEEAKAAAERAKQEAAAKKAEDDAAVANVDDMTLMAAIIYCEAGAEPYETQVAVGAVIMNRIRSVGYPNTLYGVIYQRGQFGPARTGKLARVIAQGKATASCYQAAQAAIAGTDNTGGCLHFNDYNGTRDGLIIGGMVFW
ncbi:MAG: cell wall hydrolase [Agathobacter sp.]|nr:cell wall hydrolase [Agathobacter sp.]